MPKKSNESEPESKRSCPTPETVGQLEGRIKKAAKAMQQSEADVAKAEAEEENAKVYLEDVKFETLAARAHQIGKAFLLGAELDALDKTMGATKGKHRGDTFRKRAIALLGNKNAVYRPLAIYRYLTSKGITSEEDAVFFAGDSGESYRTLADIAQGAEQQSRAAKAPGGKVKQVAAQSARKGPKATVMPKLVDDEPDDDDAGDAAGDADEGDANETDDEPKLASDEGVDYKRLQASELFNCFDSRFDDADFEPDDPDEPPAPEAIPAAIAYLIENFFPGGWDAARKWMATQGQGDADPSAVARAQDTFDKTFVEV